MNMSFSYVIFVVNLIFCDMSHDTLNISQFDKIKMNKVTILYDILHI